MNTSEGAAYGAALLAGVGAGVWLNVTDACEKVIKVTGITTPDESQAVVYRKMYSLYRELYPALKSSFQKMK